MTGLEVLNAVANRIPEKPAMSLLDALKAVCAVLERRLLVYRSDLLRDMAILTTDGTGKVDVPAQFMALDGDLYVSATRLDPLSVDMLGSTSVLVGTFPRWFVLTGSSLSVLPVTGSVIVSFPYLKSLSTVSGLVEALPLSDQFSQAYVEGVVVLLNGVWPMNHPQFQQMISEYVDVVLANRKRVISKASRIPQYF